MSKEIIDADFIDACKLEMISSLFVCVAAACKENVYYVESDRSFSLIFTGGIIIDERTIEFMVLTPYLPIIKKMNITQKPKRIIQPLGSTPFHTGDDVLKAYSSLAKELIAIIEDKQKCGVVEKIV